MSTAACKRFRPNPEENDGAYPSTAPAAGPTLLGWTPRRVPDAISECIFAFSSLETIGSCMLVSRHFRQVQMRPAIQKVFCGFLGISPAGTAHENVRKLYDVEAFIGMAEWTTKGLSAAEPLEKELVYEALFSSYLDGSELDISLVKTLMLTARKIQKVLSESVFFNEDLQQLIRQSPPQDIFLPFFLLSHFRRGHEKALALFAMSHLAFRLVFNRSDVAVCTLLADRFRHLEPTRRDPRFLKDLFTDPLYAGKDEPPYPGKVTLETIQIFYKLGARPEKTSLAYFLGQLDHFEVDDNNVVLHPYHLTLFNWLQSFDDLITEAAIGLMLETHPLLFDTAILREWLTKFNSQGKKELPASFLTSTLHWRFADGIPRADVLAYQKAVNDRVAMLLEFECSVDVESLLDSVRVDDNFGDLFVLTQANQDSLVERFNASKPTSEMAESFYKGLGDLDRNGTQITDLQPTLMLVQVWLKKNGFPPTADTLLTSLREGTGILDTDRDSGRIGPGVDPCGLERILDFHSVGTDPSIIPTPQIMVLIYFIQMRFNILHVIHDGPRNDNDLGRLNKISDWLMKNGLNIDLSSEAGFEKHLAEFIKIFPLNRQMNIISFVLDLLKGRRLTTEAIFEPLPKRVNHRKYRKWCADNGFISYPGMLSMPPAERPMARLAAPPPPGLPGPYVAGPAAPPLGGPPGFVPGFVLPPG